VRHIIVHDVVRLKERSNQARRGVNNSRRLSILRRRQRREPARS
jgi:hypothetical protein